MKIGPVTRINMQDLAIRGQVPSWMDSFVSVINQFIDTVSLTLMNRITFSENFFGFEGTYDFYDGIEKEIRNPKGAKVRGVSVIDSNGTPISSVTFSRKQQGTIGVTVNLPDPVVVLTSGTTSSGSSTISNIQSLARVKQGMIAHGQGIPTGTRVASVRADEITLTAAATASGSGVDLIFTQDSAVTSFGDVTSGSNTLTNVQNVSSLAKGYRAYGSGITSGAAVFSTSDPSVTLNARATASGTNVPLVFIPYNSVSCLLQVQY